LIIWNGSTGSGKTYACISQCVEIAEKTGTHFSIADNLDFNFTGLLRKMNLPINAKPGTNFIFEEVGITGGGGSNREWQSKINRLFFTFLQTARYRNQVLHFTCPNFSFLDKGSRSLVHLQMVADGIDFKKMLSNWKPYILQTNMTTGKTYFKHLRIFVDGDMAVIDRIRYSMPSQNILEEYEREKKKYLDTLIKDTQQEDKIVKQKAPMPVNKIRGMLQRGFTVYEIAKSLGRAQQPVGYWAKKIRAGII